MFSYLHTLLTRYAMAVLLLAVTVLFYAFFPPGLRLYPHNTALTWIADPATTQMVTWHTGQYITGTRVEYQEAEPGSPANSKIGAAEQISTNYGVISVHSVHITGLKPGTRYLYRVGNGFFWSPYYSFTTAPEAPAPFKFLLFGDSQGSSYDTWRQTVTAAHRQHADAAFFMNVGDLVDAGLSYDQWDGWFKGARGIIDTIPCMPVMGNHETYTADWKIAPPQLYTAFFRLPGNGPPALYGKVYSFNYGYAHFAILDTQFQEEADWQPDMLSQQLEWLEKDLAASKQPWKFVLMHRPPYHNRLSGDEEMRDAFTPVFERYQVDAVFSGHDHVYARSYPFTGGQWQTEGANGPVYVTAGRTGKKTFARAQPKPWNSKFYNPVDQPNYLTIEISRHTLQVKSFSLDGALLDVWQKTVL